MQNLTSCSLSLSLSLCISQALVHTLSICCVRLLSVTPSLMPSLSPFSLWFVLFKCHSLSSCVTQCSQKQCFHLYMYLYIQFAPNPTLKKKEGMEVGQDLDTCLRESFFALGNHWLNLEPSNSLWYNEGADHLYNHRAFKIKQLEEDPSQLTWTVGTGSGGTGSVGAQESVYWRAGSWMTNLLEDI